MLRSLPLLLLVVSTSACSAALGPDCVEHITDRGLVFEACDSEAWRLDDRGRQLWGYADLLLEGFDQALAEEGMGLMTPHAAGTVIELRGEHPTFGGRYLYNVNTIHLYGGSKNPWWSGALAHEFWHLYEDREMGLSQWEWQEMNETGQHFLLGDLANDFQGRARWHVLEQHPEPPAP